MEVSQVGSGCKDPDHREKPVAEISVWLLLACPQ